MKKVLLLLCLNLFLVIPLLQATDYYVAKNGDDNNPGTQAEPFLTISKAASVAQAGDVVNIMSGTYRETVTPPRSGMAGSPIVFQGAPGEKVIISAMEVVNGFTQDAGSIYKTTLNWDLGQRMFVIHDNTLLDLARWPNNIDGDRFTIDAKWNTGGSDRTNTSSGYLLSNEIPNLPWENGGSLFFFGDSRWFAWKLPVSSTSPGRIDWENNQAPGNHWVIGAHAPGRLGEFFLEGIKEALDYENEWYFDPTTRELFVQLPGGQQPSDGTIQVARRENVINISNKNYIEFRDLAVMGGSIQMNGDNNKLYQVSSFYGGMTRGSQSHGLFTRVAAITIGWKGSNVYHQNNVIEKCEIAYNDATGIRVIGGNTLIKNNYIHDCNYLASYDAPILPRDGVTTSVIGNTITRAGRDCIQIINKGSEVAYNDISHSNLIADDCGLLYTINTNLDIDIHHNWFHDAEGRGSLYKATGIYLDNDASKVRVYRNVVWNVEWTNIQINWNGIDIDIFNNTFIDGSATMGAWHKPGTAFSNVNVWNNLSDKSDWEPQSDKQNNVTYTSDPFVDKQAYNFIPKSGSEAIDAGRVIAGITDGFAGTAPDVGAYEANDNWVPGVDWDINAGPNDLCYGLPGEPCNQAVLSSQPIQTDPISIYPNPQSINGGSVYLDLGKAETEAQVAVFDQTGRLIEQLEGRGKLKLSTDLFPVSGLYVVNIKLSNGLSVSRKLVIW